MDINGRSESCLGRRTCFPEQYIGKLNDIIELDISNNKIRSMEGISSPQILFGGFLMKCLPFYSYDTSTDILLGNNFLQLFHKVLFDTLKQKNILKTSCGMCVCVYICIYIYMNLYIYIHMYIFI